MKSEKNVLVIGINYLPERTGMGKFTAGMVNFMVQNNINCSVVTSYPFHPDWKVQAPYKNISFTTEISKNKKLRIYRCPMYIPANPTGLTRMLQEATFTLSSLVVLFKLMLQKRFDAIIIISPPFHLSLMGLFYRLFRKTKVIYHIQDLQIDLANDLKMIKSRFVLKFMFKIERFILRKVDYVSTISEGMISKIKSKTDVDVVLFPNWVDVKRFFPVENSMLKTAKWNFSLKDKLILYSGNIGEKQGLEAILLVAKRFEKIPDVKFIICGNGAYKTRLVKQAKEMDVQNVYFIPLQAEEDFNDFLNIADVHLIIQKDDVSDLVMPSKLTNILSVGGHVIVTAKPETSLYKVVADNHIGLVVMPDDIDALYNSISLGIKKPKSISKTARDYALNNLSENKIMTKFLSDVGLLT